MRGISPKWHSFQSGAMVAVRFAREIVFFGRLDRKGVIGFENISQ
jgi:hypothetical protein